MSDNDKKEIQERERKAATIAENAEAYQICENCESIVMRKASMCPACHSYRFNLSTEDIIKKAIELSKRTRETALPEDFV